MLYSLTARAYLMVVDHGIRIADAIAWVTRNVPVNLRQYYSDAIYGNLMDVYYSGIGE